MIIINLIAFIAYVIDFFLCYYDVIPEEDEDAFHDFLNLFAYLGGAIGALAALIILTEKGRINAYWFVKILSILIVWGVIYMMVIDPFGWNGNGIKNEMAVHLPFIVYLVLINAIAAVLFIRDKARRRKDLNSTEVLLLLVSFIGGAPGGYFVMILTNGKQRFPHFSVGLPVMIAVQAIVIMYLFTHGII